MTDCPPGTHSLFDFCPGDCNEPVMVREKLLDLLEHTSSDVLDEMFPDVELTLDDIASLLLGEHAHELADQIRAEVAPLAVFRSEDMHALVKYGRRMADLIDPEVH